MTNDLESPNEIIQHFNAYQKVLPFIMQDFEKLKNELKHLSYDEISVVHAEIKSDINHKRIDFLEKLYPGKIDSDYYYAPHRLSIFLGREYILKVIKLLKLPYTVERTHLGNIDIQSVYSFYINIHGLVDEPRYRPTKSDNEAAAATVKRMIKEL